MQQRYYDPGIGRFLSRDPVTAYSSGDMRFFNRYTYAFNNPYAFKDPDGRCPVCLVPLIPPAVVAAGEAAAFVVSAVVVAWAGSEALNAYNESADAPAPTPTKETDDRIAGAKEGLHPARGAAGDKGQLEGAASDADKVKDILGSTNEREVRRGEGGTAKISELPDGSKVIDYPSGGGDGRGGSGDEYLSGTRTIEIQRPSGSPNEKWRFPEK